MEELIIRSKAKKPEVRDDPALLSAVAAGDQQAFRLFVARYTPLVFSLAWRMSGSTPVAEDIVQDTFLRVWRHAGRWDEGKGASVKTWLCRIATNLAIDWQRKEGRQVAGADLTLVVDEAQDTGKKTQDRQRAALVGRALKTLPDRQRAALILFHYEKMSMAETAAVLKSTEKAAENLLYRARRGLKKALEKDLKNIGDLL